MHPKFRLFQRCHNQRYDLIPAGFAFALLVCLTAFTCLLTVLQDAPWLAAFGITGGFACPLLLSTGQGNHIALFSYYALLNAGVFAQATARGSRSTPATTCKTGTSKPKRQ